MRALKNGGGSSDGALLAINNLSDIASALSARLNLGLGTAAVLDAGTTALKVLQLDASAKIPAVDGSQITNLNADSVASGTLPLARLSGITNTQIASNAAIAGTKVSPAFGAQDITLTGNITASGASILTMFSASFTGSLTAGGLFSSSSSTAVGMNPGANLKWGASAYYNGFDTGLGRYAAGVVEVNNGTAAGGAGLKLSPVTPPAAPATGYILFVDSTDSNNLKVKYSDGTTTTLATH